MAIALNITNLHTTGTWDAPTLNSALTAATVSSGLTGHGINGFAHGSSVTGLYGGGTTFTALDFTTRAYIIFKMVTTTYSFPTACDTHAAGGIRVYFIDSLNNHSGFNIYGNDITTYSPDSTKRIAFFSSYSGDAQFSIDRASTPDVSSGTLDWSDVVRIEAHADVISSANPTLGMGDLCTFDVPIITGTETMATVATAYEATFGSNSMRVMCYPTTERQSGSLQQQYGMMMGMDIGDGTTATTFINSGFSLGATNPHADQSATVKSQGKIINISTPRLYRFNQSAACVTTLTNFSWNSSSGTSFIVMGNTSGTCTFVLGNISGQDAIELAHSDSTDCIFDNNSSVLITADTTMVRGILRNNDNTADEGLLIEAAAGDFSAIDITFSGNSGKDISIDPPATGTWDLSGISVQSGYTLKVHNKHATNAITVTIPAGITTTTSTAGGTVTIDQPATTFTINSSEASSFIQIFTAGTQTVLASTTGSSLAYVHTGETVDYVVQKAGFLLQRFTSETLSGTNSVTINLSSDPVYDSAHGLTYTTDASWDRSLNQLTVPTFAPTVRGVYSLMIDSFIAQSTLYNTAFNIQMNGPNAMFLIEDAEGASDANITNMTDGGVRYVDTSDVTTAEWVGVQSIGTATGFTGEYQQIDGTTTTDARATGPFDELIKSYGDSTHGSFDYRGHLVLKFQPNGYREVRVDVLDTYGISALEPTLYTLAMAPSALTAATGDPAISITITDHTAAPITVGGKQFDYEIVDNGTNDGEAILRELNYNLSLNTTYQSKDPFNYPEFVIEAGSSHETARGRVEGQDTTTTFHGSYVSRSSADHPDFGRFQANDGTYYTPATTANISAPNLTAGRVEVVNSTGEAASAWLATTAYVVGDYVLRTTGKGTELGNGVFMVCTTAGTTGGTEPTWDVAADGNTTVDGTVTWTVRPTQFDNSTVTTGYSNSWINTEHFTTGDTIRLRWTASASESISSIGVATTGGTTTFLDTPASDTVYVGYGIDGSTVTEFAADIANIEVDITDPDDLWYVNRFYAWWKYNLTTANGIESFYGGVTAVNAANIRINDTVLDIKLDNLNTNTAIQGDNVLLFRDSGGLPVINPTTGGGGLSFYGTGVVYIAETGVSGLTASESSKLLGLGTALENADAVWEKPTTDSVPNDSYGRGVATTSKLAGLLRRK